MSKKEIIVLTDVALITCIVQRGMADEIINAAQEAGAQGATVFYARGEGVRERLGILTAGSPRTRRCPSRRGGRRGRRGCRPTTRAARCRPVPPAA